MNKNIKITCVTGELWEYDPGKGSWVRRPSDAPSDISHESPIKKERALPESTTTTEGKLCTFIKVRSSSYYNHLCVDRFCIKLLKSK